MAKQQPKRKKKSKVNKIKRNYWIDLVLATIAGIAFMPDATGYTVHQWVGVTLGVTILIHLALHWQWVVQITKRFFGKLPRRQRINYIINFGLLGSFMITLFSGLPMADWFGGGANFMEEIHEVGSSLFMILTAGHVGLHWKWIVNNSKKYLLRRNRGQKGRTTGKTAVSTT